MVFNKIITDEIISVPVILNVYFLELLEALFKNNKRMVYSEFSYS